MTHRERRVNHTWIVVNYYSTPVFLPDLPMIELTCNTSFKFYPAAVSTSIWNQLLVQKLQHTYQWKHHLIYITQRPNQPKMPPHPPTVSSSGHITVVWNACFGAKSDVLWSTHPSSAGCCPPPSASSLVSWASTSGNLSNLCPRKTCFTLSQHDGRWKSPLQWLRINPRAPQRFHSQGMNLTARLRWSVPLRGPPEARDLAFAQMNTILSVLVDHGVFKSNLSGTKELQVLCCKWR